MKLFCLYGYRDKGFSEIHVTNDSCATHAVPANESSYRDKTDSAFWLTRQMHIFIIRDVTARCPWLRKPIAHSPIVITKASYYEHAKRSPSYALGARCAGFN